MKLSEIKSLHIPDIKVLTYARFADHRGYFTETYRKSDFMPDTNFVQTNESFSRAGTFRGFHLQWNPYQGKLVRPIYGHLIDFALDIRKNSKYFGKIIAHDMPAKPAAQEAEWIWLPPGFAHGILLTEDTLIEYFCTSEYSPGNEGCISPFAPDIDWSICNPALKAKFDEIVPKTTLIADKDKDGLTLKQWQESENYAKFVFQS